MCQVSCGELRVLDEGVDLRIEVIEGAAGAWSIFGLSWHDGGEARAEEAGVKARAEQRCPEAKLGCSIAQAGGEAFDDAVETQTAKLVGDGALSEGVGRAAGKRG